MYIKFLSKIINTYYFKRKLFGRNNNILFYFFFTKGYINLCAAFFLLKSRTFNLDLRAQARKSERASAGPRDASLIKVKKELSRSILQYLIKKS